MQVRYPNLTEKLAHSNTPYPTITADHMLAAARRHAKYTRTVPPLDYEMRIFGNGSVFLRNTSIEGFDRLLSLGDVQAKSRDFWMSPHRQLWQHVLNVWL